MSAFCNLELKPDSRLPTPCPIFPADHGPGKWTDCFQADGAGLGQHWRPTWVEFSQSDYEEMADDS